MASLCHPWFTTTNLSYRFPIFETSATALCGTTGKHTDIYTFTYVYIHTRIQTYIHPYTHKFIMKHERNRETSEKPGSRWASSQPTDPISFVFPSCCLCLCQLNEQKKEEEESGTPQHFVEAGWQWCQSVWTIWKLVDLLALNINTSKTRKNILRSEKKLFRIDSNCFTLTLSREMDCERLHWGISPI